ncbi:polysaccharide deacetylase family protein [Marinobacter confluentis]|uniref:Polysaccharide deacetylase n=1 Tax=Marinobacter confluentis TaxID=1697557 RepID=A0A4Z1C2A6_9GAMM|nr:polysaccharide deacetylase family protein [Marinobacter confluentis]TGN41398.1 polysaccharide deacetylase [Marinobacter confluentis]
MIRKSGLSVFVSVLLTTAATQASADLVALQYHHVSDSTPSSTSTGVALFEDQLDLIEELGLDVVPLQSGTTDALDGKLGDKQQIAITFDDAYESVYTTAAPMLAEKGYPFTVFVNTDAVGKKGYMTWAELEEFRNNENITIANHSTDHAHMVRRPDESHDSWKNRVTESLDGAQEVLDQRLGVQVPMFAYPYGEFSEELEQMLQDRGWLGYGQQSGAIGEDSHNTRLPRFPMANAYGQIKTLQTKLTSRALPVDAEQLPDGVMEENPPTLSFTLPESMDANRLTCFASGQGAVEFEVNNQRDISLTPPAEFNSRRFRYNCTYPAGKGTFYWLSQQWVDLSQPED